MFQSVFFNDSLASNNGCNAQLYSRKKGFESNYTNNVEDVAAFEKRYVTSKLDQTEKEMKECQSRLMQMKQNIRPVEQTFFGYNKRQDFSSLWDYKNDIKSSQVLIPDLVDKLKPKQFFTRQLDDYSKSTSAGDYGYYTKVKK